jgi:hypothetical protein
MTPRIGTPGLFDVTLALAPSSGTATGSVREIRIAGITNAQVEVPGRPTISGVGSTIPAPAGAREVSFQVRRLAPRTPFMVTMAVVDDIGESSTFVGGGIDAP